MLFFMESWYVVIRQRCWELFRLGGVCLKLSKVMFVSGSLKLIRTSSRGLRGGAGVVHYALLRGVWVWTSLFQTKPWSGLETSTNPHPLTYRTWGGLVSHSQPGSASLLCASACWHYVTRSLPAQKISNVKSEKEVENTTVLIPWNNRWD